MNPEKLPQTPEHRGPSPADSPEARAEHERRLEQLEQAGKQAEVEQLEQADSVREQLKALPDSKEADPKPKADQPYNPYQRSAAKSAQYKQTVKGIQSQLPKRDKAFSRLIHQPVVESASELASKTIFRPSITLGASLGALLGGSAFYLAARHYGFSLSGTEFLLFGAIGAAIGVIAELLSVIGKKLFKRSHQP